MALFNWQSVWSIGLYSLYCNFRSMRQKEKLLCMQANKQTIRWQNDYNTIPFVQKKVTLSFALCLFIEWERTWWESWGLTQLNDECTNMFLHFAYAGIWYKKSYASIKMSLRMCHSLFFSLSHFSYIFIFSYPLPHFHSIVPSLLLLVFLSYTYIFLLAVFFFLRRSIFVYLQHPVSPISPLALFISSIFPFHLDLDVRKYIAWVCLLAIIERNEFGEIERIKCYVQIASYSEK